MTGSRVWLDRCGLDILFVGDSLGQVELGFDRTASVTMEMMLHHLGEHEAGDNVIMLLFTEFGRRVHDNGSGTDHGAAGAAFVIGEGVKGGEYSEYPSTRPEDLEQGDLVPNYDFRGLYSTILEDWMGLDANQLVGGTFEKVGLV